MIVVRKMEGLRASLLYVYIYIHTYIHTWHTYIHYIHDIHTWHTSHKWHTWHTYMTYIHTYIHDIHTHIWHIYYMYVNIYALSVYSYHEFDNCYKLIVCIVWRWLIHGCYSGSWQGASLSTWHPAWRITSYTWAQVRYENRRALSTELICIQLSVCI